jgi:hypothetical protein
MSDVAMSQGYPATADIEAVLAALGIEMIPENNMEDLYSDLKRFYWALQNAFNWAATLGVTLPSPSTFNVRGGKYLYKGDIKTYTPSTAINPTDNDTTYIWLKPDNTIDSAVDGTGWPATEHVKLAEIDVNSSGVITAVRDLRGQTFMDYSHGFEPIVLKASLTAGNTVALYTANTPYKLRILDAHSVARSADGGTWKITDGTNDIIPAVTVTSTDKTINRAAAIDDAYYEIAAGGSLSVVGDGSLADVEVTITAMRVW